MKQEEEEFVRDKAGHIYVYVEQYHASRIGSSLEFVSNAEVKPPAKVLVQRAPRTLIELRELAAKAGLDIPMDTPFAKAQNLYTAFMQAQKPDEDLTSINAFDNAGKTTN